MSVDSRVALVNFQEIRILERAGLMRRRRVGREHLLTFNTAPFDELAEWMATQRTLWMNRLDALDALLREEDRAASVACVAGSVLGPPQLSVVR